MLERAQRVHVDVVTHVFRQKCGIVVTDSDVLSSRLEFLDSLALVFVEVLHFVTFVYSTLTCKNDGNYSELER